MSTSRDDQTALMWYIFALTTLGIMWLLRLFFDITNGSAPAPEMSKGWLIAAGIFWLLGLYEAHSGYATGWEAEDKLRKAWRTGISGIISLLIIFVLSLDDTDAYGSSDRENTAFLYFIWWMYYFFSCLFRTEHTRGE